MRLPLAMWRLYKTSQRLLILQHELIGRYWRAEYLRVPRIFGITQEIGLGCKLEAGRRDFLPHHAFLDPMQRLRNIDAVAGTRGMVCYHEEAAGLQGCEHPGVHCGAIDLHVGDIVIGEEKRDQIEPADIRRYRVVEIPD